MVRVDVARISVFGNTTSVSSVGKKTVRAAVTLLRVGRGGRRRGGGEGRQRASGGEVSAAVHY